MIIRDISDKTTAFQVLVPAQNTAGETVSVGVNLCWDHRNGTSLGIGVTKPATSNLPLYAGANAAGYPGAYEDLPANSIGLVMVEGVHGSYAYNVGAASLSAAGQWQVPINAQYSGQTTDISGVGLSWTSQSLLISRGAFLMANDLSASGWTSY